MVSISVFIPFSNTDNQIKFPSTQLQFTAHSFVLTCCFKITGIFRFCLKNFFLKDAVPVSLTKIRLKKLDKVQKN